MKNFISTLSNEDIVLIIGYGASYPKEQPFKFE